MSRANGDPSDARPTPEVVILGAGMSGLCMGIQLKQAGIESFKILEKAETVGGTWRDNRYPGVACDVPSHLYSYSFELNPSWSRTYSPGPEIQRYCEHCAQKYGLARHLHFGQEVVRADYLDGEWCIRTQGGEEHRADVLVSALGGLHKPNVPKFPGLSDFAGTHFHSARWNEAHDLTGRNVAVIGSAASGIQLIPEIAPKARRLFVFQRTPNWLVPRNDRAYSTRARGLFERFPSLARLYRWLIWALLESRFPAFLQGSFMTRLVERLCLRHLEEQISDPELRRQLTPDYPPGCKRLLISDDYYPALERENVRLVTSPIDHIAADGVVTEDGESLPVDTIIFATGFQAFNFLEPMEVTGQGGRTLSDAWKNGVEAHRTVAVPGFPNFFMLLGPNSGLGHNSVIIMIESQVNYVLRCVQAMVERGLRSLDPRPEASQAFNTELQQDMDRTIWKAGCKSWYMDEKGRIFALWPGTTIRYWWEMRRPAFAEYRLERRRP